MVTPADTQNGSAAQAPGEARSAAAEASSAHSRLNIPLNLDNWRGLDQELAGKLLWFHQHCLDERLSLKEAGAAIGYDTTVVFRVLKGTYPGSWGNIERAIDSYRKIVSDRAGIQRAGFAENSISRLIWAGLDYAIANNSMTLIVGESGQGKTVACEAWRDRDNHGRTVMAEIPPVGGSKMLLRTLCEATGNNKNLAQDDALAALLRSFNAHRMLILDEARRLLPSETRGDINPVKLEIVRYIHDRTKCGVALIATQRFDDTLKKLSYQFEQVLGRIGQPVRLYRTIEEKDFVPVLEQYFSRPSRKTIDAAAGIVNAQGRMRVLVEILKVSTRIASKAGVRVSEEHFFKAIALRRQMMGETQHASKEGTAR